MSAISWQIVLIDGLFLCLAAGIGLWFRGWLKHQQRQLDQRLEILEAQHARLERVSVVLGEECPDGHAAPETFGQGHDLGL